MNRVFICVVIIATGMFLQLKAQNNWVEFNGKEKFISGMNLAWVNFGKDLTEFNEKEFTKALDDVAQAGGNSLRWWLHVNGKYSPQWNGDLISGITDNELNNLEKALDLAKDRNIMISLCLWSFDMLQENAGTENHTRNKNLVENPNATQSYIDNALIPMVQKVQGHEAIMCWEIFNEPEGMSSEFGWTPTRTNMAAVQQFINLCAGAIHREAPNEKVTNGSWSFKASSDIWGGTNNQKNYYSDEELIAKGGDTLGFLDFYMVHYYDWGGTTLSPFHHPASHWQLDKPIVIAEFSAAGPINGVDALAAYTYLFNNGYAGSIAWTWTNHDGHGGVKDAAPGMMHLFRNFPDDIAINIGNGNYAPILINKIPDARVAFDTSGIENHVDLSTIFWDYEDSTQLIYEIESISDENTLSAIIDTNNFLSVKVLQENVGSYSISIKANDTGGKSVTTTFNVTVYDPEYANIAYGKPVKASSTEDHDKKPEFAVDGNFSTRWSSIYANNQHFTIDLEKEYSIGTVKLFWETAYTKEYEIQLSVDNENWESVYYTDEGSGSEEQIDFSARMARYVKFNLITKATQWGNSLWEIEVYQKEQSTSVLQSRNFNLQLYPNPSSGLISIATTQKETIKRVEIFNSNGKLIQMIDLTNKNDFVQIKIEKQGIYFTRVELTNQQILTKKVIVN